MHFAQKLSPTLYLSVVLRSPKLLGGNGVLRRGKWVSKSVSLCQSLALFIPIPTIDRLSL